MQQEIEMILSRQLASSWVLPIFIVNTEGAVVFYNEPAESILGSRYQETGAMQAAEWAAVFSPTDEDGVKLPAETFPVRQALEKSRPSHGEFWMRGVRGVTMHLEITALPLIGQGDRKLGALAIFWETR